MTLVFAFLMSWVSVLFLHLFGYLFTGEKMGLSTKFRIAFMSMFAGTVSFDLLFRLFPNLRYSAEGNPLVLMPVIIGFAAAWIMTLRIPIRSITGEMEEYDGTDTEEEQDEAPKVIGYRIGSVITISQFTLSVIALTMILSIIIE